MIEPLRLREFNIVCYVGSTHHRLSKVHFHVDGSLFVMSPSFENHNGLVGEAVLCAGKDKTNLHLPQFAKLTSHNVKYTHHPDGRAHFSQDGQVLTRIKRQSVPLSQEQLVGPPHSNPYRDFCLSLKPTAIPRLSGSVVNSLILIGGFDPLHIAMDGNKNTSFLIMK